VKKNLLPIGLILLAALLFAPLCRTFVREVVVIPFLYMFWLVRFVTSAVPDAVTWPVFVLLLFLVLAAALFSRPNIRRERRARPEPVPAGRVETWANLLAQARREDYFKWRLGQQIQKFALRAEAHRRGQSVAQTRQQLRRGELGLPPEIQAYFEASLQPLGRLSPGRRWRLPGGKKPASPLDLEPAAVIEYLENLNSKL